MQQNKEIKIAVGPIFFYWDREKVKNFYHEIANEESISDVYVGEVICSKRDGFEFKFWQEIINNLKANGKNVIFSTLALISSDYEIKTIREIIENNNLTIEANDISTIALLNERVAEVGPLFNIYNEEAVKFLKNKNIIRITLPTETSFSSLKTFAKNNENIELGLQVFGRMPLSISSRCYHARAYDLSKANCNFSCNRDPNGLEVKTLENFPLFSVNGLQTLSHSYCNLINEIPELKKNGITNFRISPQDNIDISKICALFKDVAQDKILPSDANNIIQEQIGNIAISNGFFYDDAGMNNFKNYF